FSRDWSSDVCSSDLGNAEVAVERLDALILSGGGDVAPERYGATRHPAVGGVDEARDAWEVALIAQARQRSLPILAICRGVQILRSEERRVGKEGRRQ